MRIEVAYVGPAAEALVALDVAPGTTVEEAVAQSRIVERVAAPGEALVYAIHGRRVDPATPLGEGDRVELTRPLRRDPGLARRRRAARQR
jgi:putative ubiquitin-RnfH superfamily antitoxin RatB of RatAB toxin-antitoxin module